MPKKGKFGTKALNQSFIEFYYGFQIFVLRLSNIALIPLLKKRFKSISVGCGLRLSLFWRFRYPLRAGKFENLQKSIPVFDIRILGHGLNIMAMLAKCLPVRSVPKQRLIPSMRNDMIDNSRFDISSFGFASLTQRMTVKEPFSFLLPPSVIPTLCRAPYLFGVQLFMFLTVSFLV